MPSVAHAHIMPPTPPLSADKSCSLLPQSELLIGDVYRDVDACEPGLGVGANRLIYMYIVYPPSRIQQDVTVLILLQLVLPW